METTALTKQEILSAFEFNTPQTKHGNHPDRLFKGSEQDLQLENLN
ncbi:hypothetical protein [Paenibacillus sp. PK3_47]|nr:hypothetical protein [Paenibacillus sp. PK3_47]